MISVYDVCNDFNKSEREIQEDSWRYKATEDEIHCA